MLSILVLIKYHTTRYVKCLQRLPGPGRGFLPQTEKSAKLASTVRRRLAVAPEDPNIINSTPDDDPEADGANKECLREVQEAASAKESVLSEALLFTRRIFRVLYVVVPLFLLLGGIIRVILLAIAYPATGNRLRDTAELGASLGILLLASVPATYLHMRNKKNSKLRRLFSWDSARKGLLRTTEADWDVEAGEYSEAFLPADAVESVKNTSLRNSTRRERHPNASRKQTKEFRKHPDSRAGHPILTPQEFYGNLEVEQRTGNNNICSKAFCKDASVKKVTEV